ncbi:MAG: DUF4469 domain-containing protein [Hormoscilla sp. SP12CHS1]|nr:DUF4469 domain-containing protein [Hormoscilla sp. SP12CHS1]
MRRILVETARSGRGSETLFDLFRISLASGGSIEDPGETITQEEIDPRIVIYMAATVQRDFTNNLSIKRTGIASDRLPQIDVVRNMATENLDAYTPGNVLGVTGEDLKIAKSDSAQGLFLLPERDGPETRVQQYIDNSRGTLTVLIPGDVSGPQRLLVRVKFSENLRETIYLTILTQE